MNKTSLLTRITRNINLPLLIFLVFFLNVKFVVKLFALLFIIVYSRNFKLGLSWKKPRIPLFYAALIIIECIKYLIITRNYSLTYTMVFALGILQWTISLLAIHYVKLAVEKDEAGKVHNTIKAFFALNFIVSILFLLLLLIHPAWLAYWGHGTELTFSDPSAGDAIVGITFDASTVNAAINCLGLIYFLYRKETLFSFMSALVIVFCTSNITFLLMLGMLAFMILTVKSKKLRIRTALVTLFMIAIYIPYSPKNRQYMRDYFVQLYIFNKERQAIDTNTYHLRSDDSFFTNAYSEHLSSDSLYSFSDQKLERAVGNFISFKHIHSDPKTGYIRIPDEIYQSKPGKLISFIQTYFYLKHSFRQLMLGSGIGNFSSKLAFRASGVRTLGTYPQKYQYISADFWHNHLFTFRYYYEASASKHSVLNYPFSVYNQILGEYGLIGAGLFAGFYVWFFISGYRRLSYGRYLGIAMLCFFATEYWFEFFSLVIIFELMMFQNLNEGKEAAIPLPANHMLETENPPT